MSSLFACKRNNCSSLVFLTSIKMNDQKFCYSIFLPNSKISLFRLMSGSLLLLLCKWRIKKIRGTRKIIYRLISLLFFSIHDYFSCFMLFWLNKLSKEVGHKRKKEEYETTNKYVFSYKKNRKTKEREREKEETYS